MKHIPNAVTSLNLISGFSAIIFAARGDIVIASWLILAAMIFDFLDGMAARALNAYSDIGKELDSLADVVSFGVAPAIIIFHFISNSLSPDSLAIMSENAGNTILLLTPAIMPVCAALRLAKFNTDPTQHTSFRGLPTPANGLAVISVVIALNFGKAGYVQSLVASPALLITYTVLLSLLMISRLHLFSLKIKGFSFKGNEGRYLLLVMIVVAYMAAGTGSLPLIIPMYIIASIVHYSVNRNTAE